MSRDGKLSQSKTKDARHLAVPGVFKKMGKEAYLVAASYISRT